MALKKPIPNLSLVIHEILTAFLKKTDRKIIALGGIDNNRIEMVKDLGFEGYAMLGNIWRKYFTFVETIQ